ncbi:MAG: hypothetical protein ABW007_12840 [Chitinophagaceae bacterium]
MKEKYPLKVNLSTRASNSPYFRNFLDVGLQLDQYNYVKDYRQQMLKKAGNYFSASPELHAIETSLKEKTEAVESLRARLAEPEIYQRLVQEKEQAYLDRVKKHAAGIGGSLSGDLNTKEINATLMHKQLSDVIEDTVMTFTSYSEFITGQRKRLDSLQEDILLFRKKVDSVRRVADKNTADIRKKIYQARNKSELKKIALDNNWSDEKESKFDRFLSDVRSFGIGRSMVSYSELSVWNVAMSGLNLEFNNTKVYAAFAAGRMDYGFRDFFGSNTRARQQSLLMGRVGIGDRDNKALIFSVFTGKKYNYGIVLADSVSSYVNVTGYSVEAIFKKNAYTSISAEMAKTTRPATGAPGETGALKNLFDISDKRNLGINIKGQTKLSKYNTRVEGFLRKTGEHFQSFSLFTYNTDQLAWQMRFDQPLWKDRLNIMAMLRRNDFTHPFADKTFKTSTVFTSVQATIRVPRLPVISLGYFPGTQLYVEDNKRVLENVYYTLNASAVYMYDAGTLQMTSTAIYNRYSGKGTDSGFIAYSGVNYMFSQSLQAGKFQVNGVYNFTDQEQMRYHTAETGLEYAVTSKIRLGASGKYNSIIGGKDYWGGRAHAMIELKQLGAFQLHYDKSYLPTIFGDLFPVESGRISWFKFF